MKKASEIWDTPEATGFDRVNTKDIEEVYNDILAAFGAEPIDKEAVIETLSTLTQHHEAEVEKRVEERCKREHLPELVHDYRTKEQYEIFIKRRQEQIEYLEGLIEEAIIRKQALTPTKTDKQ